MRADARLLTCIRGWLASVDAAIAGLSTRICVSRDACHASAVAAAIAGLSTRICVSRDACHASAVAAAIAGLSTRICLCVSRDLLLEQLLKRPAARPLRLKRPARAAAIADA
jgi:hypothetical protein